MYETSPDAHGGDSPPRRTESDDWLALYRLQHEYARLLDVPHPDPLVPDVEGIVELFAEDASWIGGAHGDLYVGHAEIRKGMADHVRRAQIDKKLVQFPVLHVLTNPVIAIRGDEARGEWYMLCFHFDDPASGVSQSLKYAGSYFVDYLRTNTGWRISKMELVLHPQPRYPNQE